MEETFASVFKLHFMKKIARFIDDNICEEIAYTSVFDDTIAGWIVETNIILKNRRNSVRLHSSHTRASSSLSLPPLGEEHSDKKNSSFILLVLEHSSMSHARNRVIP